MKRLQFLILATLMAFPLLAGAQNYSFKTYDWDAKTAPAEIPEKYKDEKELLLKRLIKVELVAENGQPHQYYLYHEKTYINSDDAVERNNRMYVPFGKSESVVMNKARVILKSGKVINLDQKDILEETDEERGMKYNYFALNGLEKGAVIEKLYILEENPELEGFTVRMQDNYPILDNSFELIYPSFLQFKSKSYNGLANAVYTEKEDQEKRFLLVTEKETPAMDEDDKYANQSAAIRMFRYKLDANEGKNIRNMNNYKEFATNLYDRFHQPLDKKDVKAVEQFTKDIANTGELKDQIWNIENKIKRTISYDRYAKVQPSLGDIFKTRQANQTDLLRVYLAVFNKMGIPNEMVLTADRFRIPFDREFESFENLNDLLFYFPTINQYLTPTEVEYRIPMFPNLLGGQEGLYIKEKEFGGTRMGIGEVRYITLPDASVTHDVMEITVDLSKDPANPTITEQISFGGYSAMNFQPMKDFVTAEQYQAILKDIAKNYAVETEFKTLKTENDGVENVGKKPFVMKLEFDGKDLVRKAGENYLVSVGQLIGSQMELYQDTKRTLPVEIDNPHSYTRTIRILVPEGATVKNLDKFNMDYKADVDGKNQAGFTSAFSQKGNEILVTNTEYYNSIRYPLSSFEDYRKVINAAADFNKIVIIVNK